MRKFGHAELPLGSNFAELFKTSILYLLTSALLRLAALLGKWFNFIAEGVSR